MGKRPVWFWLFSALVIVVGLTVEIEPFRYAVYERIASFYHFAKENIVAFLAAFFLVKGKFVLKVFLKKIALLSATGLGKRYLIERVFTYHFKVHFFDHIKADLAKLIVHIKRNFMRFPLTKKLIAALAFLGSLGYVGKFMGTMLALKVFVAKIWSFLLAIVLKTGNALVYFFTDYIWGSWLAPIIDVIVFSWLFALLEKVPFFTRTIRWAYSAARSLYRRFDDFVGRIFQHPLRRTLRWLLRFIRKRIYRFIGYKRIPAYMQLRELRRFEPNAAVRLQRLRQKRREERGVRISRYEKWKKERSTRQ